VNAGSNKVETVQHGRLRRFFFNKKKEGVIGSTALLGPISSALRATERWKCICTASDEGFCSAVSGRTRSAYILAHPI
jgi:hypothetical protein